MTTTAATTYVDGLPPITVDSDALAHMLDGDPVRTALYVGADPITGTPMFSLFFDDGHGNGNCIVSVPLAELQKIPGRLVTTNPVYPCKMTIYDFDKGMATVQCESVFMDGWPKDNMLALLASTRSGLPPNFGATLVDAKGLNVR